MTQSQRRTVAILIGVLLILGGGFAVNKLTQPKPDLARCLAKIETSSTHAERENAIDSRLCLGLRDAIH